MNTLEQFSAYDLNIQLLGEAILTVQNAGNLPGGSSTVQNSAGELSAVSTPQTPSWWGWAPPRTFAVLAFVLGASAILALHST